MSSSIEEKWYITVFRGVGITLLAIIFCTLIFSAIVKATLISEGTIKAINQFIKILSVFLGCFFAVRGKLGFLKGLLIGVVSIILSHALFSLISGNVFFGAQLWLDVIFALSIGAVSGILAVNVKK